MSIVYHVIFIPWLTLPGKNLFTTIHVRDSGLVVLIAICLQKGKVIFGQKAQQAYAIYGACGPRIQHRLTGLTEGDSKMPEDTFMKAAA